MSANQPFRQCDKAHWKNESQRQETLDDVERVLPKQREDIPDHTQVTPRKRDALKLYDRLQELRLAEKDPLFD
jgi:hypothetical protein